jgi:predicted site-specific integrase-resolvase
MKAIDVRKLLNITPKTLNNWVRNNKIKFVKINDYHYEYDENDVYRILSGNKPNENRLNITYSRVSLPKQKNDLFSQTKRLYDYSISNGLTLNKQIEDIKSGMEFSKRKGFNELIDLVISGKVNNVIIENKDRLSIFGFDLLSIIFKKYGTNIILTSDVDNKTYENELTDDLLSIIHYYSMKSYSHRRKLNKIKDILNEND